MKCDTHEGHARLEPYSPREKTGASHLKFNAGLVRIWKLKKQIKFNSFCLQFDNWML